MQRQTGCSIWRVKSAREIVSSVLVVMRQTLPCGTPRRLVYSREMASPVGVASLTTTSTFAPVWAQAGLVPKNNTIVATRHTARRRQRDIFLSCGDIGLR